MSQVPRRIGAALRDPVAGASELIALGALMWLWRWLGPVVARGLWVVFAPHLKDTRGELMANVWSKKYSDTQPNYSAQRATIPLENPAKPHCLNLLCLYPPA